MEISDNCLIEFDGTMNTALQDLVLFSMYFWSPEKPGVVESIRLKPVHLTQMLQAFSQEMRKALLPQAKAKKPPTTFPSARFQRIAKSLPFYVSFGTGYLEGLAAVFDRMVHLLAKGCKPALAGDKEQQEKLYPRHVQISRWCNPVLVPIMRS